MFFFFLFILVDKVIVPLVLVLWHWQPEHHPLEQPILILLLRVEVVQLGHVAQPSNYMQLHLPNFLALHPNKYD